MEIKTFTTVAIMKEVEVRRVDESTFVDSKSVEHKTLLISFDDAECNRVVFKDKDYSHKDDYKRGTMGTLYLTIAVEPMIKNSASGIQFVSEKTNIYIKEFVPNK